MPEKLSLVAAIDEVERTGVKIKEIKMQVEKKHIFTHIEWHMSGIYMEVKEQAGDLCWMTAEQIEGEAALPTAFRQFWEETEHV